MNFGQKTIHDCQKMNANKLSVCWHSSFGESGSFLDRNSCSHDFTRSLVRLESNFPIFLGRQQNIFLDEGFDVLGFGSGCLLTGGTPYQRRPGRGPELCQDLAWSRARQPACAGAQQLLLTLVLTEGVVQNWLQHLQQCLRDQSFRHRRDTKLAPTPPIGPGDRYPAYRAGGRYVPSCNCWRITVQWVSRCREPM